jgi:hypothetical protein
VRTKARLNRAVAAIFCALAAPSLFAQAWIAPRGETTVSLTFQRTEFEGHFYFDSSKIPHGGSHSRTLSLGIEHSFTDRLALSASIPYVASKNGLDPQPVLGRTGIDDGRYHSTFQDFRIGARYTLYEGPVVVTPSLTLRIPSHSYPTIGEAAVGSDLTEADIAMDVGKVFAESFYADAGLSYAIVEKFHGVSTNRSNLDIAVGYFVTPALETRLLGSWQKTYGALTADQVFSPAGPPVRNPKISDVLWLGHDRLLRDDYFRAGAGVSYLINPKVGVSGSFVRVISGTNSHFGYLYSLSVSRTF